MDENGKKFDVIIEDNIGRNPDTGMPIIFGFTVWADSGMGDIIKAIPGVHHATAFDTVYYVDLDPRYDREFLRAEIEAQLKINSGKTE